MSQGELISLIIGYVGSVLLIISFLAQLYSIYVSKEVDNISYTFVLLQLIVNIMFVIYNISIWSIPMILGNGSITILLIVMAGQKLYYSKKHKDFLLSETSPQQRSLYTELYNNA